MLLTLGLCALTQVPFTGHLHFDDDEATDGVTGTEWAPDEANGEVNRCGSVDEEESSAWLSNKVKHFQLHVDVSDWESFEDVTITWPESEGHIRIEKAWEATIIGSTPHSVTLELGVEGNIAEHSSFGLMGSGSQSLSPHITCRMVAEPPPSPPHASDCKLQPSYTVKNAWEEGEIVELNFARWDAGRVVTLTYWGQHISVGEVQGALLYDHFPHGADTVVELELLEPRTGIDVTGEVTFQISPVARRPPHIICHSTWKPPPPSPRPRRPPAPPPPGPPPPLPPRPSPAVRASTDTCPLGGIVSSRPDPSDRSGESVGVVVQLAHWSERARYEVTITGYSVAVLGVPRNALLMGERKLLGGDGSVFTFELGPDPRGEAMAGGLSHGGVPPASARGGGASDAEFDFVAKGINVQIVALSCTLRDSGGGSGGPYTYGSPFSSSSSSPPPEAEHRYQHEQAGLDEELSEAATEGVGSASVVMVVALAALGVAFYVSPRLQNSPAGIAVRRVCDKCGIKFSRTAKLSTRDADEEQAMSKVGMDVGADDRARADRKKKWMVSVELGDDEPYQLSVAMADVDTAEALKIKIARACCDNLGRDATPDSWLNLGEQDLDTLSVQFLHPRDGSALVMSDATDFDLVLKSRTLRVTEKRAKVRSRHAPAITMEDM